MKLILTAWCLLQIVINASGSTTPSSNNGLNDVLPYMDLRVGKFVNVSKHPTSPADFHLGQVDFGGKDKNVTVLPGPMPRQVSVETFKNGSFIFVFNTTSIYIKGYYSHARLLVAEDWYKTEPVRAPLGAQPGDYVSIQGYEELFKRTPISYEHFTDVRRLIEREIEVKNNTLLWKGNPVVSYGNVITTKSVDNGYLILK